MDSEPHVSETSSLFERLMGNRGLTLFLPFIFGFSSGSSPGRNSEDPDQENEGTEDTRHQRVILINPLTQGMVIFDGAASLETLFHEMGSGKCGPPPASKESIDAMPSVEIGEGEENGVCVICLEEWEVGGVAKMMPCNHKFHPNCIEKWLGIHGSCPVCRYEMPVGEKDEGNKRDVEAAGGGGEGERRRRVGSGREVWVSFSLHSGRGANEDPNQAPLGDSIDSSPIQ